MSVTPASIHRRGFEHLPRFVAQSRLAATRGQSLPEHVGQEADQDVGLHSIFFLMPHRADRQVGLVNVMCSTISSSVVASLRLPAKIS